MHQSSFCWSHLDYNTAVDAVDENEKANKSEQFLEIHVLRKIKVGFLFYIFKAVLSICELMVQSCFWYTLSVY